MTRPKPAYPTSTKPGKRGRPTAAPDGLGEIFAFYKVKDEEQAAAITRFLSLHPSLVPFLLDAREHLRGVFGDVPVVLRDSIDPEDGWEMLWVYYHLQPGADALALRHRFAEEWWLQAYRCLEDSWLGFTWDYGDGGV